VIITPSSDEFCSHLVVQKHQDRNIVRNLSSLSEFPMDIKKKIFTIIIFYFIEILNRDQIVVYLVINNLCLKRYLTNKEINI